MKATGSKQAMRHRLAAETAVLVTAALCMGMSFAVTGCGDDDDPTVAPPVGTNTTDTASAARLVGTTWHGAIDSGSDGFSLTFTLNSDGSLPWEDERYAVYTGTGSWTRSGTYGVTLNKLDGMTFVATWNGSDKLTGTLYARNLVERPSFTFTKVK
jgi:hypothetical protein